MFPPAIVSPLRLLALAGGLVLALAASPASAASYKLIYSFKGGFGGPVPSDGASPQAALINIGGTLYGTTSGGGGTTSCNSFDDGCGTVFKITPPAPLKTTWIETVLYRFKGGSDGALSEARLLNVGGTLYGTTDSGGTGCGGIGCGTVFKLTPPTAPKTAWTEAVLHRFKSSSDGEGPEAGLIDVGGTLYGTTAAGGGSTGCFTNVPGCGTVFKLAPQGAETVLHAFDGFRSDGGQPTGSLLNVGGTLYGTTLADRGTVFKITIKGVETVLHYFSGGSDASAPWAGLVDLGGTLYGTTVQGGGKGCPIGSFDNGCGTVFAVNPTTRAELVLYAFKGGSDGAGPQASLVNVGGVLYGTTAAGGGGSCKTPYDSGCGTVFEITPQGAETVLHVFGGAGDGTEPLAGLLDVGGTLYGTTQQGGAYGAGTVFKITP